MEYAKCVQNNVAYGKTNPRVTKRKRSPLNLMKIYLLQNLIITSNKLR